MKDASSPKAFLGCVVFLSSACHAAPEPSETPPATLSTTPATADASSTAAPNTDAESSALTKEKLTALAEEWSIVFGQPFTVEDYETMDADQQWFTRSCIEFVRPLMTAVKAERQKSAEIDVASFIPRFLAEFDATAISAPTVRRCATSMIRDTRAYLYDARTVEAKVNLEAIGREMVIRYDETKKLCPASSRAAPEKWDVAMGHYIVSNEFDAPTWKCVRFKPFADKTRFQYSLQTTGDTFIASATGSVRRDETTQRYDLTGKIEGGKLVVGEVTGPSGKELAKDTVVEL